jgi:hypothetical protein
MFPSSAILEEIFLSSGEGNGIKGRYAISASMGFKWRKGSVETFSGERGSNGEKEVLRHFLESGVQMEKGRHVVFSGERGSQWRSQVIVRRLGFKWRMGFIILANKMSGFKCSDPGSFARRKISGFKKTKKRSNDNP